jgi:hypothetical protein
MKTNLLLVSIGIILGIVIIYQHKPEIFSSSSGTVVGVDAPADAPAADFNNYILKGKKMIEIDATNLEISICDKCPPSPDDGNLHFCQGHEPTFDELLDAIEQVESSGDANAMGDWTLWQQVDYSEWYVSHLLPEFAFSAGHSKGCFIKEAKAIGSFQIWKVYVDEVNRILKLQGRPKRYTYADRWDREKSREMTFIHNDYWGEHYKHLDDISYDEAFIRSHKGAGGCKDPNTVEYYEKVRKELYNGSK